MTSVLYIPTDAAALAVGADEVAAAFQAEISRRGLDVQIVRTGSRGLFWLEPMIEINQDGGRIAYGPVEPDDVAGLLDAGLMLGGDHRLRLGPPDEIPYLKAQTRLTFARCGLVDPISVADYRAHGGYVGLDRALAMDATAIVDEVKLSGLRGRGGAGFPTGIKWNTVRLAVDNQKYIVCNADEGDSGTFADRMLMEGDPLSLVEGMTIAALAVGATKGFIYIRSEYPHAFAAMNRAILAATEAGYLGPSVAGSGHAFTIEARLGAGAYICGEETSLLESLEGRRGLVRAKPPLPALKGLFGKPTVVNNVMSLATVPWIMANGAQAYADFGMGRSRGTLPIQLAGNIKQGGLIETAFGLTLRQVLDQFGGGTATGRPIRAVQVGGPLGAYFPDRLFDTPMDYEAFAAVKGLIGHGGIVVFDDTVDLAHQARFAFEFCAQESCGKCTPCRIGATRGVETMDKVLSGVERAKNLELIDDLCQLMTEASLCAMGGLTPVPVLSAITHFPDDFNRAPLLAAAE
ncbi:formate dehydrogenase beta subunit [Lichenihabitans psoromatis]|uniref:formate dehydrogenase beta subunit n=1 Tax=Lichenihabitans psoromatis TaxID=2528642 RepID=UPI001035A6DA|nr:NADH-quinone oxidoreductase subunit NuoF [Lichenihabitans psoromatis]